MSAQETDPVPIYRERLKIREALEADRARLQSRLSYLRLVIFLGGLPVLWGVAQGGLHWAWLLLPVALFGTSLRLHEAVIRQRRRAERAAAFYRSGIDRLEDRWAGTGSTGSEFLDPEHPYAADLDLFGDGSLFQLLSLARTRSGARQLAAWLLAPAAPAEIRQRQAAVAELRPRIDLREQLAVVGEEVGSRVHPNALADWGARESKLPARWPVIVAALLGTANVATLVRWMAVSFDPEPGTSLFAGAAPFLVSVVLSLILTTIFGRRADSVLEGVERPAHELQLLARVLEVLEAEDLESPRLRELRESLGVESGRASRRIAALARLVDVNESRKNMIFRLVSDLVLLGTQLAFALERWRSAHGRDLANWLDSVGQLEALSSLAGYAYEHPIDPFPEIVDRRPTFDGAGLAHPLIPRSVAVPNDVALSGELRLLLISGSNMSGKSTLLRTVGTNAVLAFAGAPVRAASLKLSPLTVGASMRVQDSLQRGMSHFYAEIQRLRHLVDLGNDDAPLIFLLDEILHGTNSHDRRIGAAGLIAGLVARGAIGLVTTHDLALASIPEELGARAINVHFVDHLEGDQIHFDYTLREGVVRKSNALELMRAIGLDV